MSAELGGIMMLRPPRPAPASFFVAALLLSGAAPQRLAIIPGADGEDGAHAATFVLTQDGLNNAPQLYKAFIADAIAAGNAEIKKPRYFCDTLKGVVGCNVAQCTCEVRERPAWVRMFPDRLRGTLQPNNDIFRLKGPASGIHIELLPAGESFLGAVKFTAPVEIGLQVPVKGKGLTGGGFFGLCCSGFIWAGDCDCRGQGHDCGCDDICDSPDVGIRAVTQLEVTVLLHHNHTTGAVSGSMDHCPAGACVDIPNLNKDLKVDRGCLGTMIEKASGSSMLNFLAWITGGGSVGSLAEKMIQEQKDKILPTINDWLRQQLPMAAPTTCGADCNLPAGVELSYKFAGAPVFFAEPGASASSRYIEAVLDLKVCVQGMPECFEARNPVTPPLASTVSFSSCPGAGNTCSGGGLFPSVAPQQRRMLSGVRVSSSFVNGITWAMGRAGKYATFTNTTALDASLTFNVSWANSNEPPNVTVPAGVIDQVDFRWPHGFVRVVCNSLPAKPDMMNFRWMELRGNGTLNHSLGGCNHARPESCECGDPSRSCGPNDQVCEKYTEAHGCRNAANPAGRCIWNNEKCVANTCMAPQVKTFDTSHSELQLISPKLPLPDELITKAMETALIEGKGELNQVLVDSSVCLPEDVAQYLTPPPIVTLYPQEGHHGHGFIELVSYCGGTGHQACLYKGSSTVISAKTRTVKSLSSVHASTLRLSERDRCASSIERAASCRQAERSDEDECDPVPQECKESSLGLHAEAPVIIDRSSTYTQDGREYFYGAFVMSSECLVGKSFECPVGKSSEKSICQANFFQNGACQEPGVVRRCVGDVYSEVRFKNQNCTGGIESNESRPQKKCTSSKIVASNITHELFFAAVCPRLKPLAEAPGDSERHSAWYVVMAIVIAVAAVALPWLLIRSRRSLSMASLQGNSPRLQTIRTTAVRAWQRVSLATVAFCGSLLSAAQSAGAWLIDLISPACRRCADSGQAMISYVWRRSQRAFTACAAGSKFLVAMRPRSCQQYNVHDWVNLSLNCLAALGFAVHGLLWTYRDPFEAFDRNVMQEVGLSDGSTANVVNISAVQEHFRHWSYWGKRVQAYAVALIGMAVLVGTIKQVTPMRRATVSSLALMVVAIGQVSIMLAPPFLFDMQLTVNDVKNESYSRFVGDPEFRHQANAALSLAFDGVALTFISSLYMFLLHGLAPGVFLGSCVFGAHLISLHHSETVRESRVSLQLKTLSRPLMRPAGRQSDTAAILSGSQDSALELSSVDDAVRSADRSTFTVGFNMGSLQSWREDGEDRADISLPMSRRLLQQQQPRVRIVNWIVLLGAPCGGCLPVIIVYQSLGAETWWAVLWLCSWVIPTGLMYPLILSLQSRGEFGWGVVQLAGTAVAYMTLYGALTMAILIGLLEKAKDGGFCEFTIEFPLSTFVSTVLGAMALTNNYLQRALLLDAQRQHMANQLLAKTTMRSQQSANMTPVDEGLRASDGSRPASASSMLEAQEPGSSGAPADRPCCRQSVVGFCSCWERLRSCTWGCSRRPRTSVIVPGAVGCLYTRWLQPIVHWLIEKNEHNDPHQYGRRLPSRRLSLAVGTGLTFWVMREDYRDNDGFRETFVLQNVKEMLERADAGLQWPEGNATVLDEALDTYGECLKVEFLILCLSFTLLCCACWCDWFVRDHSGLQFSRTFGFVGLALMFLSSLIPAYPNYLRITRMDTLCPCCAQKFNFLVSTLLQDMVGIVCSGLFAFKLLPVLLVVVPSMVRACTLILADDIHTVNSHNRKIRDAVSDPVSHSLQQFSVELHSQDTVQLYTTAMTDYGDPAFSRSNVHSVLAMCSMLTPVFTAIPMTVLLQFLRRPDYNTSHYDFKLLNLSNLAFMSVCMGIFYFAPIVLGLIHCNTIVSVEMRYILWMLVYFGPLLALLIHEAIVFGFADDVVAQLKEPITYYEIACEVLIANVILSDIMYSNLYVERRAKHSGAEELDRIERGASGESWWSNLTCARVYKLVVLGVCPLVLCSVGIATSMTVLECSIQAKWHTPLHCSSFKAPKEYPHANNGHPCPWESSAIGACGA